MFYKKIFQALDSATKYEAIEEEWRSPFCLPPCIPLLKPAIITIS